MNVPYSNHVVPHTSVSVEDAAEAGCLVVFSGGQDSTTCLGLALKYFKRVYAVSFDYGQKHAVEIHCAKAILQDFQVDHYVMPIDIFTAIGDSNMLAGTGSVNDNHTRLTNLPASFVPNRNAMMLTAAHALAQKLGCQFLMTGVCQTDYSGYPDCREDFIVSLQGALNMGSEADITILTPLMHLTKAQTWALAEACDFLETVRVMSHTCYNGDHNHLHEWGYGCGECPACKLRAKGYQEFAQEYYK